ncbi:MAG: thioesterase family protein, partial [Pseudoxanthomonas sp.]
AMSNDKAPVGKRADYPHVLAIPTRWMDNDLYGHVNNVVYYSFFDTVVNGYLVAQGALDIAKSEVIGLVVETQCNYFKPVAFPDRVSAGLRVEHLGTSSVRYGIGLFRKDREQPAAAGWFVHVFVDRHSRRSTPLPEKLREALSRLLVEA